MFIIHKYTVYKPTCQGQNNGSPGQKKCPWMWTGYTVFFAELWHNIYELKLN